MSSRNAYLDPQQRKQALVLSRALARVQELFNRGERSTAKLIACGKGVFADQPAARIDYFSIVNPESLEPVVEIHGEILVAVAAYVGTTRLIDNLVIKAE
jgi:pantoate--beta-alanine ligase